MWGSGTGLQEGFQLKAWFEPGLPGRSVGSGETEKQERCELGEGARRYTAVNKETG